MTKPIGNSGYASAKRVEKLEQTVEDMQRALESQTEIIIDLRERVVPQSVDVGFRRAQSPAVRNLNGIEPGSSIDGAPRTNAVNRRP